MYLVGQSVVYGIHGVCTIVDIEEKYIDHKPMQYYVLESLSQPGTKYYVPMHNAIAVSKLRLPLTREDALGMTQNSELNMSLWIDEENQRKVYYRELIKNTDPQAILDTVRLLHNHRDIQYAHGRKFHISDANFLKDAENLLVNEFAFVLDIDKSEALNLI